MPPASRKSLPVFTPASRRLPSWLNRPLPRSNENFLTSKLLRQLRLETVCDNARCPNRPECYARRTATFLIMGKVCTRHCGFCAVAHGRPANLEDDEPQRLAEMAHQLGLRHVVLTSVTRDDLPDGGAAHFARCIQAIHARTAATVEVLTPDFQGDTRALDCVLQARPQVFNHNLETVPRLYSLVRPRAVYQRSLDVLAYVARQAGDIKTKSGLMLGLGETIEELLDALADLRQAGCQWLTMGQYLPPTPQHLAVRRFVPPEEFARLGQWARTLGFSQVASGPLVRSSYRAEEMVPHHD